METLQCNGLLPRSMAGHRVEMCEVAAGWGSAPMLGSLAAPVTREDGWWCWSGVVLRQHGFK